jgi:predicted AlkP superfamily phosphohydrolase/phosphomutase
LPGKNSPLLIFGFDAGDPEFLVEWALQGFLPNLASILQRGCNARTAGPELISEHGVWVPMFSGISRGELDYYYFRQLKPRTYELQPVTGLDIDAPPFWSSLADLSVAIIDIPEIYPVPGVKGIQLSNWAPHFGWSSNHPAFQTWSEPKSLIPDLKQKFGAPASIVENANSRLAEDQTIYNALLDRIKRKGQVCRHLLNQGNFDLMIVVFTESHTAGHQFWKYRPEVVPEEGPLTHAIRDVYAAVDREMGSILETLPASCNVVVASSVGMEDYYPTVGMTETFCRQLGYQVAPGPAPLSFHPMSFARQIVPEKWRIAASRFLPRDTRERLLSQQFANGSDWNQTQAFAIPAFYNGLIRVNLREREPSGIVDYGKEYLPLLQKLEDDLRLLVDPKTGRSAIKNVHRPGPLFGIDPPNAFPDLWIHWQPARHFLDHVHHPGAELKQERPEFFRNSDHSHEGFFAAAGPAFAARGRVEAVEILDLAPTFLQLVGAPPSPRMKGTTLNRLLK